MLVFLQTNQRLAGFFEYNPILWFDVPDPLFIAFTCDVLSGSLEPGVDNSMYFLKEKVLVFFPL